MRQVNVHEAKTQLSKLLEQVEGGEEIIIARAGKPVARLGPLEQKRVKRAGALKGQIHVPDDFDDPLPDDIMRAFEGE